MVAERSDVLPALGEAFREYGVAGASLSVITQATGLGKGSLYHFFPGGKEEMVAAVLSEIDSWFQRHVFDPLETSGEPGRAIEDMFTAVDAYFQSGRRVCLIGALALGNTRDAFADAIGGYFDRWVRSLARALHKAGHARGRAKDLAEDIVSGIQGALILARASDDSAIFTRAIGRLRRSARDVRG